MKKKVYLVDKLKVWLLMIFAFCIILIAGILKIAIEYETYRPFLILVLILLVIVLYVGYRLVYHNYKEIEKLSRLYSEGYLSNDVLYKDINISPTWDKTWEIMAEKLDKIKVLNLSKKQAQYLALQNQINPHFLYNTLEGIRSEALCAGIEGVASMTEALATFFRYTISNIDKLVMLEDELTNIENYYSIQKYRFGDKLNLSIEYGDDMRILNLRLPKLILQPIVENAVYHGIESKLGQGNLKIRVDRTKTRLIIKISDDGMGMEPAILEDLNKKLLTNYMEDITETDRRKKGGIAVINVNNRIKLLFGEEYGIYIQSTKNVGTDVEVTLPIVEE